MLFCRQSSGGWRKLYALFCGAVVFNATWFYVLNRSIEKDVYYTGSWYDIPYSGSFALFSVIALAGHGLSPSQASDSEESYSSLMMNMAMLSIGGKIRHTKVTRRRHSAWSANISITHSRVA